MIGVIPNPKKSFQIEKPIAEVRSAIEYIQFLSEKYKLHKANSLLNEFTYSASEFLSAGVYIDISAFSKGESITEVTIEIRRKIGSFDQSVEVSNANTHLAKITELLSQGLGISQSERVGKIEQLKKQQENAEKERLQAMEDSRRREQEEKENNPVKYYSRIALYILIIACLIAGMAWMISKM